MVQKTAQRMQPYARIHGDVLSDSRLYAKPAPLALDVIETAIEQSFQRSGLDKLGKTRKKLETPEQLVDICIKHLRERSDPILSPSFVSQCAIENLFELDAVSHEMQRHRMTMGAFYQYLLLALTHMRFPHSFDGSGEDDIVVDIDTPPIGEHIWIKAMCAFPSVLGSNRDFKNWGTMTIRGKTAKIAADSGVIYPVGSAKLMFYHQMSYRLPW